MDDFHRRQIIKKLSSDYLEQEMNRKNILSGFAFAVATNLVAATLIYLITAGVDKFLELNLKPYFLVAFIVVLSSFITVFIFFKSYTLLVIRLLHLKLLKEDSATRSFGLFIDIARRLFIWKLKEGPLDESNEIIEDILKTLGTIVTSRRQPLEIIAHDIKKIVSEAYSRSSDSSMLVDQIIYYLDFVEYYKKFATHRVKKQVSNYIRTFEKSGSQYDYVLIYGHSTNVVESIIESYKIQKFPIIIIEDLQYHEQSLGEHQIVFQKLSENSIDAYVLRFSQIGDLFKKEIGQITDINGKKLALLRKRKLHAFLGCERINTNGNVLIPARFKGIPSESALFLQEMETYAKRFDGMGTLARLIIVAESYKIRDYDLKNAIKTHVPYKQNFLHDVLFLAGIKHSPKMQEVSLFEVPSSQIYVHINELGIFPNVNGIFDLSYCTNTFFSEAGLLGVFSNTPFLNYSLLDNIQAVLFDFNGVIIDDEYLQHKAFNEALKSFGVNLTVYDYRELCGGLSDYEGFVNVINKFGLSEVIDDVDSMVTRKFEAYLSLLEKRTNLLLPGVRTFLDLLKKYGYVTALVTASTRKEIEFTLSILNIKKYFDVIITNDDVAESKPSPEGYLLALSLLDINKSRCLVLEDNPENINQLMKVGIRSVVIKNDSIKSDYNATCVINSIEDFLIK